MIKFMKNCARNYDASLENNSFAVALAENRAVKFR